MNHSPFLVCNYEFKSIKEDNPEYYEVEGFASVYGNIDSYRDIVMPGAFAKDLLENGSERPILWQHNSAEPVGVGIFEERGEQGLFVKIKMPKADKFVSERVMPQIKAGAVKGLSIGYFVVIDEYDREQRVTRLKECKLRETSCVTFPANSLAQITAAKQFLGLDLEENSTALKMYPLADEKTEWNKEEAISSLKENTNSNESPSKNYGKGFLKIINEKSFDGYLYPYIKYIDGEFRIVPKAVYQIAGQIGTKLGNDEIKQFVNSVYKKLGKEEPFKSDNTFFVDKATLKNMDNSDLESVLDDRNVILSTGAKQEIINALRSPGEDGSVLDFSGVLDALNELNNTI